MIPPMADELSRMEQTVGRYLLFGPVGAGGMATVHVGRLVGPAGFAKLVAIKRLHPHLAKEREFVTSFLDEARIASRVRHPNVVSVDDVVIEGNEVLLVMEFVRGRALSLLLAKERDRRHVVPPPIACAIATDMLQGLHAAHTARDERGRPLALVHRDVSPQNVLVGADGVSRVLDFGIAKALNRLHTTTDGAVKGKLAYMAPERLVDDAQVTPSVDVYGAAIVLWEMLSGERYFGTASDPALIPKVMEAKYRHLTDPELGGLDAVLERALAREPEKRFASCRDLVFALEQEVVVASRVEVADWLQRVAGDELAATTAALTDIERGSVPAMRAQPESTTVTSKAVVRSTTTEDVPTVSVERTKKVPIVATGGIVGGAALIAIFAAGTFRTQPAASSAQPTPAAPAALAAASTAATDVASPAASTDAQLAPPKVVTSANAEPTPATLKGTGHGRTRVTPPKGVGDAGATPTVDAGTKSNDLDGPSDRK